MVCFHVSAVPSVGSAKADSATWPSAVTCIFIRSLINIFGQKDITLFCFMVPARSASEGSSVLRDCSLAWNR